MINSSNNTGNNLAQSKDLQQQKSPIKVLIVDDQKMIREGLKALIKLETDIEIVGVAENGQEAIASVEALSPNVVLMDMEMPGMNGMDATKEICQRFQGVKVLVLSTFDHQEYVARSLSFGAMGYLLKGTPAKELTDAIRSVHRGYAQIGPGVYQNFSLSQNQTLESEKLPAMSPLASRTQERAGELKSYPQGQLVPTDKNKSASAIVNRDRSGGMPRKFEQTVILRQSPKWSRATIYGVVGVTAFAIIWSFVAKIEQVVPAQGQIQPLGKLQEIQVPTNGVVEKVAVEEGQRVEKGDLLLVLDSTTSEAQLKSLQQVNNSLTQENKFYRALMNEEIDGNQIEATIAKLDIPREITYLTRNRTELKAETEMFRAQLGETTATLAPEQQARLQASQAELRSRVTAARLEVEQLEKQLNQNQLQLADNREQLTTAKLVLAEIKQRNQESMVQLEESLKIERETLASIEPLVAEGALSKLQADRQRQQVSDRISTLVDRRSSGTIEYDRQQQEIKTLQAEIQRLLEEEQRLRLNIAQAQEEFTNTTTFSEKDLLDKIAENRKRIAEIDTQLNRTIVNNDKQIAETTSQMSNAQQTLKYQTIVAPVSGAIFDLRAYPGYVPPSGQAAQPVLQIVPEDELVAEVFITPENIGFVQKGMKTDVRISAFPYSEFGDVKGEVVSISKSALAPEPPYDFFRYVAKINLDQPYITIRGEKTPLQSGMSVQANIKVRENRTVFSLFGEKFFTGLDKFKEVR
ncbi:MAG: response regulator [Pleurocapsa sp.]